MENNSAAYSGRPMPSTFSGENEMGNGERSIANGAPAMARVCIIYAYPSISEGHGSRILQTVQSVLTEAGASIDLIDLYRANFNPVTSMEEHALYGKSVLADVAAYQARLALAEVWFFLYPVWWSTPPAILKGFIDRVFTPGFAFKFEGKVMQPLLEGKRALVIRTFGGSALNEQLSGEVAENFMDKAVLGACGLKVSAQDIYSVESMAETAFNHALFQTSGYSRRMLVAPTGVPHRLRSISAPYLPPIEPKIRLPVDAEGEEKIELSDEAKSDLEYFKSARRKARDDVHRRADLRTGGGVSRPKTERGAFGSGRGGREAGSFGTSREGSSSGSYGSGRGSSNKGGFASQSERGSFGSGRASASTSSFGGRNRNARNSFGSGRSDSRSSNSSGARGGMPPSSTSGSGTPPLSSTGRPREGGQYFGRKSQETRREGTPFWKAGKKKHRRR